MKQIYQDIWNLARPYYEKGRPMDIDHIEWFMQVAQEICEKENLDDSLLIPLAILHDTGYSKVKDVETANYYDKDIRKAHMAAGKEIALDILKQVNYPQDKAEKIAQYVGVHDEWAYGKVEIYLDDPPILGTFKDLDYLWIYSEKGFPAIQKVLGKTPEEALEHLRGEPSPIYGKKPFSNKSTQLLHDEYLAQREIEVAGGSLSKEIS